MTKFFRSVLKVSCLLLLNQASLNVEGQVTLEDAASPSANGDTTNSKLTLVADNVVDTNSKLSLVADNLETKVDGWFKYADGSLKGKYKFLIGALATVGGAISTKLYFDHTKKVDEEYKLKESERLMALWSNGPAENPSLRRF